MRATRAIIHLDNLKFNISQIRSLIGKNRKICLPVKANAYGHGIEMISRAASDMDIQYLAIATIDEAKIIRESGINLPLLLFCPPMPEEIEDLINLNIEPFVTTLDQVFLIAKVAKKLKKKALLHIKIDTGMGRIGCRPSQLVEIATTISEDNNLELIGISTHFAVSDSSKYEDIEYTKKQINLFNECKKQLQYVGIPDLMMHGSNSGAVVLHPDAWFDMVRPGISLYGYEPVREKPIGFKPVLDLKSKIIEIKEVEPGESISYGRTWIADDKTKIATIPIGYGDGFSRSLSNRGTVQIKGKSYPIVGRVCMDQFMINIGYDTIDLYEDVTLFGPDKPGLDASNIADMLDTIPYEITCNVAARVPRVYI